MGELERRLRRIVDFLDSAVSHLKLKMFALRPGPACQQIAYESKQELLAK